MCTADTAMAARVETSMKKNLRRESDGGVSSSDVTHGRVGRRFTSLLAHSHPPPLMFRSDAKAPSAEPTANDIIPKAEDRDLVTSRVTGTENSSDTATPETATQVTFPTRAEDREDLPACGDSSPLEHSRETPKPATVATAETDFHVPPPLSGRLRQRRAEKGVRTVRGGVRGVVGRRFAPRPLRTHTCGSARQRSRGPSSLKRRKTAPCPTPRWPQAPPPPPRQRLGASPPAA